MDGENSLPVLFVVRLVSATTFSATSRARLRYASAGAQSRGGAGGRELAGAECVNRDGSTTRPVASAGKAGGKVRAGAAVPASAAGGGPPLHSTRHRAMRNRLRPVATRSAPSAAAPGRSTSARISSSATLNLARGRDAVSRLPEKRKVGGSIPAP